jgi:hypothetical protein
MKTRLAVIFMLGWLAAALGGCGEPLPSGPALQPYAEKARDEAAAAEARGDAKAARRAADRAEAASKKAAREAKAAPPEAQAAAQELAQAVRAAAREAVKFADLADEEKRLAKKCGGIRAKGYRAARGVALKAVYGGLALAAEHAGAKGYDALSPDQQGLADRALALVADARTPDGKPDWKAVAQRLRAWSAAPPPDHACFLAIAFLMCRQNDLALFEAAALEAPPEADPQLATLCRGLRGVVFCLSDYPRLSTRELEAAAGDPKVAENPDWGPQTQGAICLGLALLAAHDGEYEAADVHIMRATRLWPNNPIGVLLTGEVLAAEGKYEKAAVTLEDLLKELGEKPDPWVLDLVQKRARAIRDAKGPVEPLFHNPSFQTEAAVHLLWEAARTSEAARRLKAYVESARQFGAECLRHLPGMGETRSAATDAGDQDQRNLSGPSSEQEPGDEEEGRRQPER